jgi:hypothetical protein
MTDKEKLKKSDEPEATPEEKQKKEVKQNDFSEKVSDSSKSIDTQKIPAVDEKKTEIPKEEEKNGTTHEKKPLQTVKEEVEKVANESWFLLKKAFGKVKEISNDATELTKLKIEHKKLLDRKEAILLDIGKSVWEKHKNGERLKAKDYESQFEELEQLEQNIAELKEKIDKIKILQ